MASLQWSPHPILTVPSSEEQIALGPERLIDYWERREAAISRENGDPFNYGTEQIPGTDVRKALDKFEIREL